MNLCNIMFFNSRMECTYEDEISSPEIDIDYTSVSTSTIYLQKTNSIPDIGFVYITGDYTFFGIIDKVKQEDKDVTTVNIKPFYALFDATIVVDSRAQNSKKKDKNASNANSQKSLERFIYDCINTNWPLGTNGVITITDELDENMYYPINLSYIQTVRKWNLELEGYDDDTPQNTYSLVDDIIIPAFERYGVVITAYPVFGAQLGSSGGLSITYNYINMNIASRSSFVSNNGAYNSIETSLELDDDGVTIKSFVPYSIEDDTNKLIVYDADHMDTYRTYYRHPDGTYNRTNNNRIIPVVLEKAIVRKADNESFADAADTEANSVFEKATFSNCVEFEVTFNHENIRPLERNIGEIANIYYCGKCIRSMLTGIKYGNNITLTYGLLRVKLTKKVSKKKKKK